MYRGILIEYSQHMSPVPAAPAAPPQRTQAPQRTAPQRLWKQMSSAGDGYGSEGNDDAHAALKKRKAEEREGGGSGLRIAKNDCKLDLGSFDREIAEETPLDAFMYLTNATRPSKEECSVKGGSRWKSTEIRVMKKILYRRSHV